MMAETYLNHFNVDCHHNTGSNTGKNGGVMVYKMTLGLRNFTQKTAECYFKGRKTISYFTWLIIGCYAAINAVQLLRLVFILKLFFNHISSFDYKLFQNYFYFRKFHNIRFIFVSIIFLIWFAKRH